MVSSWRYRAARVDLVSTHAPTSCMIPTSTLLAAYRTGHFPMAVRGQIQWFSPDRRGIIPLDRFHVPARLRRVLRQAHFDLSVDRAFRDVITACASRADVTGNWIDAKIIESYKALHDAGFAHSIEAWQDDRLVGGLYGVSFHGAFFGESMFHRATNASKVALCALVDRLQARRYVLLDIQWLTPHLERLGAIEVSRQQYLQLLAESMQVERAFV